MCYFTICSPWHYLRLFHDRCKYVGRTKNGTHTGNLGFQGMSLRGCSECSFCCYVKNVSFIHVIQHYRVFCPEYPQFGSKSISKSLFFLYCDQRSLVNWKLRSCLDCGTKALSSVSEFNCIGIKKRLAIAWIDQNVIFRFYAWWILIWSIESWS